MLYLIPNSARLWLLVALVAHFHLQEEQTRSDFKQQHADKISEDWEKEKILLKQMIEDNIVTIPQAGGSGGAMDITTSASGGGGGGAAAITAHHAAVSIDQLPKGGLEEVYDKVMLNFTRHQLQGNRHVATAPSMWCLHDRCGACAP
jgi:galactokinase/mevalonate kinase-like predicted kinase